jgi:hypothetical protein
VTAIAMRLHLIVLIGLLSFLCPGYTRAEGPVLTFKADAKVQQEAMTQGERLIDFATKNGIQLDWSDDSIQRVERIAADLHEAYKKGRASARTARIFSDMLGSYLGEVYRRNHEAEWGWVISQGSRVPGMRSKGETLFWPMGRAENRVINGPADNLWHYYQVLLNPNTTTLRK